MKKNLLSNAELSLFCYQLSLIFKSGIPLDEAMPVFADEIKNPSLKNIAQQIKIDMEQGANIHSAIKKHEQFPKYMVGMIEIAYNTGRLEEELDRLSNYYQDRERVNQKISNAVTYPIILATLMLLVIAFLVSKVIPMFNDILSSIGASVPRGTQVLLNIGLILGRYGLFLLLILLICGIGGYFYTKNTSDAWKYRLAFVGNINRKILSEKFAVGMSMLMKGGYSFDDALDIYIHSIDSKFVAEKLQTAQENIIQGADVSTELTKIGIFPDLFIKMISIGYKTGELENSFNKVASVYKIEVEKTLNKVTATLEPALVIVLSFIVGVILFSVMTPLISIISFL